MVWRGAVDITMAGTYKDGVTLPSTLGFWERNYGKTPAEIAGVFSETKNSAQAMAEVTATATAARTGLLHARTGLLHLRVKIDVSSASVSGRMPGAWKVKLLWTPPGSQIITYDVTYESTPDLLLTSSGSGLRGIVTAALVKLGAEIDVNIIAEAMPVSDVMRIAKTLDKIRKTCWVGYSVGLLRRRTSRSSGHAWVGCSARRLGKDATIVVILHDQTKRSECEEDVIASGVLREFKRKDWGCVVTTLPRPHDVQHVRSAVDEHVDRARHWLAYARRCANLPLIGVVESQLVTMTTRHLDPYSFVIGMNGDLVHTTSRDTITVTMRTQVHGYVFDERIGVDARSGHAVLLDRPEPYLLMCSGQRATDWYGLGPAGFNASSVNAWHSEYQCIPTHPSIFKIEP